jgi:hypothetical protein
MILFNGLRACFVTLVLTFFNMVPSVFYFNIYQVSLLKEIS